MKKPRGDAKLKTLPDAQQLEIYELLRVKRGVEVKAYIAEKLGVETSVGALSDFYHWYPLTRRIEQAKSFASQLREDLQKLPDLQMDADKLSQIAQVAFEARAVQDQDSELYVALRKRRQKDAELALQESKHKLELEKYQEKISAAKQSLERAKSKGGLSADTLKLIEEQLKLL